MLDVRYAEISTRLLALHLGNGFNIEDLFTRAEWMEIGDGLARQSFGKQFARDVKKKTVFPSVTRNDPPNESGGNEARYIYNPVAENGQ